MNSVLENRDKLRERLLDDFRRQYDESKETWRALETKAQVAMTVGGVFLAAVFAFARDIDKLGPGEKLLLCTAIAFLVVTVLCGLAVFRVIAVEGPPLGTFTREGVFDILKKADADLPGYVDRFSQDQATTWASAINSIDVANDRKATWVWRAQLSLVVAVPITAVFTVVRVVQQ
jgi:hypothetical protein